MCVLLELSFENGNARSSAQIHSQVTCKGQESQCPENVDEEN